jgi:N-acetylglucosamine-6-phosphate deacetylase
MPHKSEALDELETPPLTPSSANGAGSPPQAASRGELHLDKGQVADLSFERPFYEMIVDGIHSHPNSVRVSSTY